MPQGKVGIPYTAKIEGGCGEYERFRATTNTTGLTFTEDGTLSGTPTKAGTFDLTVNYYYNGEYRTYKNFKVVIADYTKINFPTANADLKYDGSVKIGSAENLNMQIGTTAVNALIGNAENIVFAYSMQALGKTAFGFAEISGFNVLWFIETT